MSDGNDSIIGVGRGEARASSVPAIAATAASGTQAPLALDLRAIEALRPSLNARLEAHFHGGPAYNSCDAAADILRLLDAVDVLRSALREARGAWATPESETPTVGGQAGDAHHGLSVLARQIARVLAGTSRINKGDRQILGAVIQELDGFIERAAAVLASVKDAP